MASGFNKVILIGNVGRDPEMRYTPQGTPVTSFSIAVSRSFGKGEDRSEATEWFGITAWNQTAEACNQFLQKGSRVCVEGRVELHKWNGQDGIERARLEVTASNVLFLSGRREAVESTDTPAGDIEPDDIPF